MSNPPYAEFGKIKGISMPFYVIIFVCYVTLVEVVARAFFFFKRSIYDSLPFYYNDSESRFVDLVL
jgi:hypothetical protein